MTAHTRRHRGGSWGSVSWALLLVFGALLASATTALAYWTITVVLGSPNFALAQAATLSAPTAPTGTVNGSTSITIGWTLPGTQLSGAQYRVTRTSGPGSSFLVCNVSSTTTSCTDSGLTAGTAYGYSLVASLGSSWQSAPITTSATTLAVSTSSLPGWDATASGYTTTLAATGGTGTYSSWAQTGGTLPVGLSLNTSTGVISGTPTTAGTSSGLVFTVTDSHGATASSSSLSIVISPALAVSTSSLPGWDANATGYTTTLAASGGSGAYSSWAQTGGTLPVGLTLNTGTGVIGGTPTTAGTSSGLVFKVTDSNGVTASSGSLSIVISPALSVTTSSLPGWDANFAGYSKTLVASGGTGTYSSWAQTGGTLPAGLSLNTGTGVISGTPTTPGTSSGLVFRVTDSNGATASSPSLSIMINPALSVSTASLPGWDANVAGYSATVAASGGTGTYSSWAQTAGTLPAGLSFNTSTGVISGTPTTVGTSSGLVFRVTDSLGATASSGPLSIVISGPPSVTTASLPSGKQNTLYTSTTLTESGGSAPFTWSIASGSAAQLPTGLTLSSSGTISGTPGGATHGMYTITFQVTDGSGVSATKALTLTIAS